MITLTVPHRQRSVSTTNQNLNEDNVVTPPTTRYLLKGPPKGSSPPKPLSSWLVTIQGIAIFTVSYLWVKVVFPSKYKNSWEDNTLSIGLQHLRIHSSCFHHPHPDHRSSPLASCPGLLFPPSHSPSPLPPATTFKKLSPCRFPA